MDQLIYNDYHVFGVTTFDHKIPDSILRIIGITVIGLNACLVLSAPELENLQMRPYLLPHSEGRFWNFFAIKINEPKTIAVYIFIPVIITINFAAVIYFNKTIVIQSLIQCCFVTIPMSVIGVGSLLGFKQVNYAVGLVEISPTLMTTSSAGAIKINQRLHNGYHVFGVTTFDHRVSKIIIRTMILAGIGMTMLSMYCISVPFALRYLIICKRRLVTMSMLMLLYIPAITCVIIVVFGMNSCLISSDPELEDIQMKPYLLPNAEGRLWNFVATKISSPKTIVLYLFLSITVFINFITAIYFNIKVFKALKINLYSEHEQKAYFDLQKTMVVQSVVQFCFSVVPFSVLGLGSLLNFRDISYAVGVIEVSPAVMTTCTVLSVPQYREKIRNGELIYIIPSIILYILEVYVMFFGIHKSKFNNSSFNHIFAIYVVNNIISEIMYYFFTRMISAPMFSGFFEKISGTSIILGVFWQLLFHTLLVNNLLDLVLSLNRFTAVLMPIRYKTLWIGKIRWILAVIIILPYILFWPIPFEEVTIAYNNVSEEHYIFFNKFPPITWPFVTAIFSVAITVMCFGCLLCNVYVGFKLRRRKNIVADLNYQQEKVYFFFMMFIFASQLLSCSSMWMLNYGNADVFEFALKYQFIVYDLSSLIPAWGLFLTSSTLRKGIYEVVTKKSERVTRLNTAVMGSTTGPVQFF
ncbi:hypothetical protein FO519_003996 [Halicephalobus sp. NKZ332]|nr:hypothetical protein FO519_003996 [Halicephalobus sp. NKZ332]